MSSITDSCPDPSVPGRTRNKTGKANAAHKVGLRCPWKTPPHQGISDGSRGTAQMHLVNVSSTLGRANEETIQMVHCTGPPVLRPPKVSLHLHELSIKGFSRYLWTRARKTPSLGPGWHSRGWITCLRRYTWTYKKLQRFHPRLLPPNDRVESTMFLRMANEIYNIKIPFSLLICKIMATTRLVKDCFLSTTVSGDAYEWDGAAAVRFFLHFSFITRVRSTTTTTTKEPLQR